MSFGDRPSTVVDSCIKINKIVQVELPNYDTIYRFSLLDWFATCIVCSSPSLGIWRARVSLPFVWISACPSRQLFYCYYIVATFRVGSSRWPSSLQRFSSVADKILAAKLVLQVYLGCRLEIASLHLSSRTTWIAVATTGGRRPLLFVSGRLRREFEAPDHFHQKPDSASRFGKLNVTGLVIARPRYCDLSRDWLSKTVE